MDIKQNCSALIALKKDV